MARDSNPLPGASSHGGADPRLRSAPLGRLGPPGGVPLVDLRVLQPRGRRARLRHRARSLEAGRGRERRPHLLRGCRTPTPRSWRTSSSRSSRAPRRRPSSTRAWPPSRPLFLTLLPGRLGLHLHDAHLRRHAAPDPPVPRAARHARRPGAGGRRGGAWRTPSPRRPSCAGLHRDARQPHLVMTDIAAAVAAGRGAQRRRARWSRSTTPSSARSSSTRCRSAPI